MVREDDEAWRAIVDNFGERADLDPEEGSTGPTAESAAREAPEVFAPRFDDALGPDDGRGDTDPAAGAGADPDRFVPPEPPPLPRPSRDRLAAWAGVLGSPVLLLLFVILQVRPPALVSWALVAGFVGGFLYLVVRMPREPRDPWDDGAQV